MSSLRILPFAFILNSCAVLFGQDAAELSGTVVDPGTAGVAGAAVSLFEVRDGSIRRAVTTRGGIYVFDSLRPGDYTVEVEKQGFQKLRLERVHVGIRDRRTLVLPLQLKPADPVIIPTGERASGISTDGATGTPVDRAYSAMLPLNGRSVYSVILLSAGVVSAAAGSGGGDAVSANGLGPRMNYYVLDGVSAVPDAGSGAGAGPERTPAENPARALSVDAAEEVRVQTASFAPEFGRSPGAQISIVTPAGSNIFHGSLFEYLANDRLNANDWFANRSGLPRGSVRNNDFGGTLGGPVARNRSYFFLSYEGLRLRQPETAVSMVPTLKVRQSAAPALWSYLAAFPLPNGPELGTGAARFTAVVSNPSTSDSGSVRVDHTFRERFSLFARYGYARAHGKFRGGGFVEPNVLTDRSFRSQSGTAALSWTLTPLTTNDLRVNVTTSSSSSTSTMDNFGGASPLTAGARFPDGIAGSAGALRFSVAGMGLYLSGSNSREKQQQLNIVNHLTSLQEAHILKLGVDIRRLTPTLYRPPYSQDITFNGLAASPGPSGSLLSGSATTAVISSNETVVYPSFFYFSLYAQDTWKATSRTTLTFGLRWEMNPAPSTRSGSPVFSYTGTKVSDSEPLYPRRWRDFAPRLGLAYQMDTKPGREMVFRIGAGLFYDIGYGAGIDPFGGAPFSSKRILKLPAFPFTAGNLAPPALPATLPYGQVNVAGTSLLSSQVYHWTVSIERNLGFTQSVSAAYVRTKGRRLARVDALPYYSENFELLRVAYSDAISDYQGFETRFARRLAPNFQSQISYTWAHSIDTMRADSGGAGFATLSGNERGNSDFDVRHSLSASGSYRPIAPKSGPARKIFGDWWVDWVLTFRSALPFDVEGISAVSSETSESSLSTEHGLFAQVRPHYTGQPLWLDDSLAPGGRRLNPAAFLLRQDYAQGSLGRNSLRGFSAAQLDLSLRRQIAVGERRRIQLAAQAFNILNRPNFAPFSFHESAHLASPNFGVAQRTLNLSAGGGLASPGQMGGPRSLQLSLRLQF